MPPTAQSGRLESIVSLRAESVLNPLIANGARFDSAKPVLVVLAAGKGTRFGKSPKCIQPVAGVPLARHSINAFGRFSDSPSICIVGYCADQVASALGDDQIHVVSENPTGGTAQAAYEAFSVSALVASNPILIVTMGDRIVPATVLQELLDTHGRNIEADLTMLTAIYTPPKNQGKGRVVRDPCGSITSILEQRDVEALPPGLQREQLLAQQEGNCPLYAIRADKLKRYLGQVDNHNSQQQFYFTDIVAAIQRDGGVIRSITVAPEDPSYELLCADVTNQSDLLRLEQVYNDYSLLINDSLGESSPHVRGVAERIAADRPSGQIASIANQLDEILAQPAGDDRPSLQPDQPIAIGISGGRLRIAFMHPDMGRFFGPAWQMPIGAGDQSGREQVVVLMQSSTDRRIRLYPANPAFREVENSIAADLPCMFPGDEINESHLYESFGTSMAEQILATLGYVNDEQIKRRCEQGAALPPATQWISNSMRRPFSLLANSIASMRTLRTGPLGERVQASLGRENFVGLKVLSTGDIPQGGFSSSSAVTVAVLNALNSLFDFRLHADQLVDLACQAEYGTGVMAGALDQATEQKGTADQGALISSNPRENYRVIRTFPVPAKRFRVLFPYSVDRDREAWRWSAGMYGQTVEQPRLTTAELRKMTGKAAEIAAILMRLPLDRDFFPEIEDDLVEHGELTASSALHVKDRLASIPIRMKQQELRSRLQENEPWYVEQLMQHRRLSRAEAGGIATTTVQSLLSGWRDPLMTRATDEGNVVEEVGAPLRAMMGYLYGEVAKNCYLVHHPEQWIQWVSRSQLGDRCFDIEASSLPSKKSMMSELPWEKNVSAEGRMELWLERFGARPFDFNRGLDDRSLAAESAWSLQHIEGTNFFRGLPLIDLAEAMLKRAFSDSAVAVRVNGAGQGDYFQVHVDTELIDPEEVKQFIRIAFYRRFSLSPINDFVEPHPGGGAVGRRLNRCDELPSLIRELRRHAVSARKRDETKSQHNDDSVPVQ